MRETNAKRHHQKRKEKRRRRREVFPSLNRQPLGKWIVSDQRGDGGGGDGDGDSDGPLMGSALTDRCLSNQTALRGFI